MKEAIALQICRNICEKQIIELFLQEIHSWEEMVHTQNINYKDPLK